MVEVIRKSSTERNASERIALQAFLKRQPEGATLAWLDVERATGIVMDHRGRALVRQALRALHRPCETLRGLGIRLSSNGSALIILGGGIRAIHNVTKRVHRTYVDLSQRHLSALPEEEKTRFILTGSILGALMGNATDAERALPPKEVPQPDPKAIAKG